MKKVLLLIVGSVLLAFGPQISAQDLLATTNQGELVAIDLAAGTATLIGDAGIFNGKDVGWTGLSLDATGNLFAISRAYSEPDTDCALSPLLFGPCAHLYLLDSTTGSILSEIGNTQASFVSDIDFASGATLYGTYWNNQGNLITIDPAFANASQVGQFGNLIENGGLSVNRATGEVWVVESNFALDNGGQVSIFQVDASTGAAIFPIIDIGLNGVPVSFGFDALEILPGGRFIATRARGNSSVYEINPVPDAVSGLAEITLLPLVLDAAITGNLNGLESLAKTIVIDIRPGKKRDKPNRVKPKSRGKVKVAILGTYDFDALQVDQATIEFGPDGAAPVRCKVKDTNKDHLPDLVCKFKIRETGIACGDTDATLVGTTFAGQLLIGTDSIRTKCRGRERKHHHEDDGHD